MIENLNLWFKALHIISVISWMAGLLYLPRLFVYHADAVPGSELYATLLIMERRLYRIIIIPAMFSSLLFGSLLLGEADINIWQELWWQVKVVCIFFLVAVQIAMGYWRGLFVRERNMHGSKFFRYINEVPTVLMIIIVLMVIIRPT